MTLRKGDFSRGKVSGNILRLGLPMMLAELVHVLYNIVDRMYIGRMPGDGTIALTGLGVCFPLITLIGAFANLCSTGGATLATIARGEGRDEKAERIMGTAFTMLLIIGVFLSAVLYAAAPGILRLLGGDAETLPAALAYFRIYVLGTVPVLISLGMNPFINAQGFPRTGMMTVIIGAALNIVLDYLMIYTFHMGIAGAALATVVSQTVSAVWVLAFLRSRHAPLRLRHALSSFACTTTFCFTPASSSPISSSLPFSSSTSAVIVWLHSSFVGVQAVTVHPGTVSPRPGRA